MEGVLKVRVADVAGDDAHVVSSLIGAYLRRTELEKTEHGLAQFDGTESLPEAYEREIREPETAFAGSTVLLASDGQYDIGVAVLRPSELGSEIKRLWVHPAHRRKHAGRALLDEVIRRSPDLLRLSVWEWREAALQAYDRAGFVIVPSWESRPALICLERRRRS